MSSLQKESWRLFSSFNSLILDMTYASLTIFMNNKSEL